MNEIGREIFKNVYSTMKERKYSCLLNPSGEVERIRIKDNTNPNLLIYIATKKFKRVRQHDLQSIIPSIEALLTDKVIKDAILEIFMPVISFNPKDSGEGYAATAYAVIKYSHPYPLGFSHLVGRILLMKITSGLDNSIGICTDLAPSKIVLLTLVQEILYKKEDILEYLI